MQNASKQMCGDPWLKNGCATNFETRPRFRVIVFHFFTDFFNVILLYVLQAETPPAAQQNTFYESLSKDPPQAPLFNVWIVAKKNWFHQSENHWKISATHSYKNNIFFGFVFFLLSIVFVYYCLLCSLSLF